MKNFIFIMVVLTANVFASSTYSQRTKISLELTDSGLREVLREIRKQTEFTILYKSADVKEVDNLDGNFENATVMEILDECLEGTNLGYEIEDKVIVIHPVTFRKTVEPTEKIQQKKEVYGKVTDKNGYPLSGATVLVKMDGIAMMIAATVTNENGEYSLTVNTDTVWLEISYVGYVSQKILVGDKTTINVVLEESVENLGEVVINGGVFELKKESFTGTAVVVKAEELKTMGTDNVVKSLSLIDPSFNIIENNTLGSDPNALPEIRLRGSSILTAPNAEFSQTSLIGDPNLPTFILDNFETSLQTVLDLDMNRVESVTILKDAAATAFYGSRAANGVIVIKTKQPESGKLQISYNLSVDFSFPDLGSYDLLNGPELFELQKELGIYHFKDLNTTKWETSKIEQLIASGVDTDWLAQPVRNAVGQKHSLNLMGGDKHMRYMFDFSYADRPGVMKGSSRKTTGLALSLSYNLNKKVIFKNRLSVNKNNSTDSPYGSFSDYAKMQPYFPIHDEDGNLIEKYIIMDEPTHKKYNYFPYHNPLYEATVGNMYESAYMDVNNNFSLDWRFLSRLRFRANISYTHTSKNSEWFRSPDSYYYWHEENLEEKGEYRFSNSIEEKYYGNAILSFMEDFNGHFINALLGFNVSESSKRIVGFSAQGFAAKGHADPSFAAGYGINDIPASQEGKIRLVGALASINYSYRNRYLFDFTYRTDGSSQFGTEDKTAGFFSTGLGWNIHNENFLKDNELISLLKLKGTYGETGSVNFSAYQAKDIVQYYTDFRYMGGLGTYLKGIGNDHLKWQTTEVTDLGLELGLFEDRLSMTFNHYKKTTIDMITSIITPPSLGFDSYTENLGEMENKGFEFALRAQLIKKKDFIWNVYVLGHQNRSRIVSIGNSLESYNKLGDNTSDEELSHNFLVRFEEGESNSAIWAVRSLGIDPMTGEELFLTKEGLPTFDWNPEDKVVVGDREPDLRGTFGTNISYKEFDLNLTFAYEFGNQVYNTTLVDKVENSNKEFNVDRRVLEETWKKPGDVVKYKTNYDWRGYQVFTTPASSRFVQDQNLVSLASVNMNYNLPKKICKKLKAESVKLSFNMNDVFYWSTVQRERGFSYPFVRSFSVGLRANF